MFAVSFVCFVGLSVVLMFMIRALNLTLGVLDMFIVVIVIIKNELVPTEEIEDFI